MNILIIDSQGGGVGKSLIEKLTFLKDKGHILTAVGTNANATAAMLKAGATYGATGEAAIEYNCRKAQIIAGPIGIIFTHAMHGEITSKIAAAITASDAVKVLLPINKCGAYITGIVDRPLARDIDEAVGVIENIIQNA